MGLLGLPSLGGLELPPGFGGEKAEDIDAV